jgi:RND family efflux transporter MFP subunit
MKMKVYSNLCVAAVAVCLFAACSDKKGAEKQEKIIPVKVITVETGCTPSLQRAYVGTVEESVAVSLAFSSMGTVERVFVSEGQQVRKGQVLATLNAATADNSYQMMLAKEQQAQDAYDRLVKVHDNGSLPDVKFVEVETGLQQAKSMVAVAKKNLDDCRMVAPFAGIIATRSVEVGASANPGMAAFKLISINNLNVKIFVSENEINSIAKGQKARIEVTALDNAIFTGKVAIKGVAANVMSHTYEVKIGIDKNVETRRATSLLPGMVCKVFFEGNTETTSIVVPNRAVQISADGRRFIWLAADNVAKRRFVETGDFTNTGIIVTKGLSANDKIMVEGFQKISEGMKIKSEL